MKTKNLLLTIALLTPFCCLADTAKNDQPNIPETWIAFLPVIFFALILIVTTVKLKSTVKSSGLLAEKDKNAAPVAGSSTGTPTPPQSTSRAIAFLTGLVALTIGVCLSTFYMYCYFKDPAKPADLSNLTTVIYGLGIGVLPYGFNKASSALK